MPFSSLGQITSSPGIWPTWADGTQLSWPAHRDPRVFFDYPHRHANHASMEIFPGPCATRYSSRAAQVPWVG